MLNTQQEIMFTMIHVCWTGNALGYQRLCSADRGHDAQLEVSQSIWRSNYEDALGQMSRTQSIFLLFVSMRRLG